MTSWRPYPFGLAVCCSYGSLGGPSMQLYRTVVLSFETKVEEGLTPRTHTLGLWREYKPWWWSLHCLWDPSSLFQFFFEGIMHVHSLPLFPPYFLSFSPSWQCFCCYNLIFIAGSVKMADYVYGSYPHWPPYQTWSVSHILLVLFRTCFLIFCNLKRV